MTPLPLRIAVALNDVAEELSAAIAAHPPFHSAHEGYAVILEELDELWAEITPRMKNHAAIRKEALQVAAMALRYIVDLEPDRPNRDDQTGDE